MHVAYDWREPSWSVDRSALPRDFELAYATALVATGLPDRPWWDESGPTPRGRRGRCTTTPTPATGRSSPTPSRRPARPARPRARIVALWLAGQGTDDPTGALHRAAGDGTGVDYSDLFPDEPYDGTIPPLVPIFGTLSTGDDIRAAIALAAEPAATVDEVVRTHWDELVDPATPVSRLFELVGAPRAGRGATRTVRCRRSGAARHAVRRPGRADGAGTVNRARLGRFRAVVGPATPHLLHATRWQPLPVSSGFSLRCSSPGPTVILRST